MAHLTVRRGTLQPRLLHIGFGGFARAHTVAVVQRMLDALPAAQADWGIRVARLHSGTELLNALDTAGGSYVLVEIDNAGARTKQIDCILGTFQPARDGGEAVVRALSEPELIAVTLTVTEKGYCLRNGMLNSEDPSVKADLARGGWRSLPGLLVEGLNRRRTAGLPGLALLSCDNLPENGRLLARSVLDFARARDAGLADWIAKTTTFPSSMVDRITPALDNEGRALIADLTGADDPNGIVTEPFLQWVIEDRFHGPRPPLHLGGAQFVTDIRPWEAMKLRMLNASHTMLAHLGGLLGFQTIDECMGDNRLVEAARRLMLDEAAPTLPPLAGADLPGYGQALLARFANTHLRHRCSQIATDTSQKLPQRLLAPITWHLSRGSAWPIMSLTVAGWMAWARGRDDSGRTLPLNDPLAEQIGEAGAIPDGPSYVAALLALREIFPPNLSGDPRFVSAIQSAYASLRSEGVRTVLDRAISHRDLP
ncbi:mannitol dehydrogenase family protein [Oricola cellulosilytica]|uniref:Mannitol dehydrogenase family protein n=1 Tax=Oricola cellulosilytica TaxID=1429082 RepID=A0A4R0PBN9_9HYPH|nr:mannitol dehydrogenase family protein [Oricola cellulosilytica]TCD13357.1 mannitol dehydrogenase family protein [Oricola cellulosilytica]